MATVKIEGYDEVLRELAALGGDKSDAAQKKAIFEGAAIMHTAIANKLRSTVSSNATGDLERSLGISPIRLNKAGNWNNKIGFAGYDRKGVPNQLKARALNSGTSRQRKTQFMDIAVRQARGVAERKMREVLNVELFKFTNFS